MYTPCLLRWVWISQTDVVQVSSLFDLMPTGEAAQMPEQEMATFAACKAASKTIKGIETTLASHAKTQWKDIMPTREEADRFVQAYLRTFQTVFGIVHVPSFRQHYQAFWNDADSPSQDFAMTLMAVICIGTACSSCPDEAATLRPRVIQWVSAISTYLSSSEAPHDLDGLRIHCLHFSACQTCSIKPCRNGLLSGSLLQAAMQIGLHIEPSETSRPLYPPLELECRRRLWATVLELEIQASMDHGTLLLVDSDDYTCRPPSNIDDTSLEGAVPATPMRMDQYTQCSMQVLLTKSLPARLRIARFLNGPSSGDMYQKALDLSASLAETIHATAALVDTYRMSSRPPTTFQTSLLHLFLHRFMLALHLPFASHANKSNLAYYYSQKVCFDTALSLLPPYHPTAGSDDFGRLQLRGSGPFRSVPRQCALYLCGELVQPTTASCLSPTSRPVASPSIRPAVRRYVELAVARLAEGERSFRCVALVSCLVAHASAVRGGPVAAESLLIVAVALRKILKRCHGILNQRAQAMAQNFNVTPQSSAATVFGDAFDWPESCKMGMTDDLDLQDWSEYIGV